MLRDGTDRLGLLASALLLGAVAVLLLDPGAGPGPEARYQRGVGGLGIGPAVHAAPCGRAYDGRVSPHCVWRHGARPGADCYCPLHGRPASGRGTIGPR